jgi:translation initiation factor 1
MSKKNKLNSSSPLVYSTDPNYSPAFEEETVETLAPALQALRVILETKHRAGKTVTIVYGFEGKEEDRNALGKALKNHCGTGGSVKDGEIIIQGDHRQKVFQYLKQKGYSKAKL